MSTKWIWMVVAAVVVLLLMRVIGTASDEVQAAVSEKLKQGAQVLDVRTASEYAAGHYPGSTNIPLQELAGRVTELGQTNQSIVVYCVSGSRSARAKKILQAAGFKDVTNAGGLSDMPQ